MFRLSFVSMVQLSSLSDAIDCAKLIKIILMPKNKPHFHWDFLKI